MGGIDPLDPTPRKYAITGTHYSTFDIVFYCESATNGGCEFRGGHGARYDRIGKMLENWAVVRTFVKKVLSPKEEEERVSRRVAVQHV